MRECRFSRRNPSVRTAADRREYAKNVQNGLPLRFSPNGLPKKRFPQTEGETGTRFACRDRIRIQSDYVLGYLIIGLLAGWVASKIVRGRGSGLVVNLAVGLVGGILGGWLVSLIGWIPMGSFGSLLTSIAGAIVLLWLVSLVTRDTPTGKGH